MSLYPSLEDMQVDKLMTAQHKQFNAYTAAVANAPPPAFPMHTTNPYPQLNDMTNTTTTTTSVGSTGMYPNMGDFMGLELSQQMIAENFPEYIRDGHSSGAVVPAAQSNRIGSMVAPLSGGSVGVQRAHVTNGIRELIVCKGGDSKVGLRVKDINAGIFVSIVVKGSPAAMAGLRFGDQILQINGVVVAGYSMDALHKLIRKSDKNDISIVVRDRPFERALTLHKDSAGRVGFQFNNGKITNIVKDSTAARNGVLINHQLLEINGQNVVGLKDKEITKLIDGAGQIVAITIVPTFIYDHMMTKLVIVICFFLLFKLLICFCFYF